MIRFLRSAVESAVENHGFALSICIGVIALVRILWVYRTKKQQSTSSPEASNLTSYPAIKPLKHFQLSESQPPVFRPFKPTYHLTMAIENVDANDLILFDNTYVERISLRCSLLQQHREDVIGVTDISNTQIQTSIKELYNYLFAYYLPTRYPSIFHTYQDEKRTAITKNLITNQTFPAAADKSIPIQSALETICQNIDEDFFILLPDDPHNPEETTYTLKSYSACFPSGFKPIDKLGKKLADIHGPVPGYKAKLQKSMDRFFAKLQPGRFVKRVNWGITVDEELYSNFDKSGPAFEGKLKAMTLEELDLDKAFLRCERQTLHRLPASGAIVFAFHTYLYPIQDIRNEGLGEDLACAIEGLQRGSTPEMFTYKNGEKWADAVKEFLRI